MADVLDGYTLKYEDMPKKKYNLIKKETRKMSKKQEVPTAKVKKSYSKTRAEHYKDIVIAVLVTGIIAFMLGANMQSKQQTALIDAVQALTPTASATESTTELK